MDNDLMKKVNELFTDYLKKNNLRKTPERYNILYAIYDIEEHFTVEHLYSIMKEKKYRVSRATLYNTIEILSDCYLIKKHLFNEKTVLYEKAYKTGQHDHLICKVCGKIIEFFDPGLHELQKEIAALNDFKVTHHELYIYGVCSDCAKKKT